MKLFKSLSLVTVLLLSIVAFAQGAVGGPAQSTAVNLTIQESLTFTLTGGPIVIPGTLATLSNTLTANVTYNLTPGNHSQGIRTATWMGSATAALVNPTGPTNVPSANVAVVSNEGSGACLLAADAPTGSLNLATCTFAAAHGLDQIALGITPAGTFADTYQLKIVNALPATPGLYTGLFYVNYIAP